MRTGNDDRDVGVATSADPRRWYIMAIFMFQQGINLMLWITFAPIAIEVAEFFAVSLLWVNALSQVVLVTFLPGLIWCSYYTARHGLRQVMLTMGGIHITACLLRCAALPAMAAGSTNAALAFLLLGQALSGLAQPFLMNPVRIATEWFPINERDMATTVGVGGFAGGSVIGMLLPTLLVGKSTSEHGVVGIDTLLVVDLAFCLIGLAWTWLCFADEPALPPSRSAAIQRSAAQTMRNSELSFGDVASKVFADYSLLLADRDVLILVLNFGIGLGSFNSIVTMLEQLIEPAGYAPKDAALFCAVLFGAGSFASPVCAVIMDRTHAYRRMWKWVCRCNALSLLCVVLSLRPDCYNLMLASCAFLGCTSLPTLPVTLASAAEVTYPLADQSSTGLLFFAGNLVGALFIPAYGALIPLAPHYDGTVWTPAAMFTLAGQVICVVSTFFYRGESKRTMVEMAVDEGDAHHPLL